MDKNASSPPLNLESRNVRNIDDYFEYVINSVIPHLLNNREKHLEKGNSSINFSPISTSGHCFAIKFPSKWNLIRSAKKV